MVSLYDIPEDLLLKIFSYLDIYTLTKISRVSRLFYSISKQYDVNKHDNWNRKILFNTVKLLDKDDYLFWYLESGWIISCSIVFPVVDELILRLKSNGGTPCKQRTIGETLQFFKNSVVRKVCSGCNQYYGCSIYNKNKERTCSPNEFCRVKTPPHCKSVHSFDQGRMS
jgi:hypothetical protein